MRFRDSLSRFGLAALVAGGLALAAPQKAHAEDLYVETVANNGSDSNDGLGLETPFATVNRARLAISQFYADSTIHLGSGIFNEGVLNFGDAAVDIVGEGTDPSNPNNYTELNASIIAGGPMHVSNLASRGFDFGTGGFVGFTSGGSLEDCFLTEKGAIQVDNGGGQVDITDCTFQGMTPGVPAIYVENIGSKAGQLFNIEGTTFNGGTAFRVGANVNEVSAGDSNMYLGCDPIATSPYSVNTFVDLEGSYVEGAGKSGEGTEGLCGPDPGITDIFELQGLVENLPNAYFGGNARYPHRPRYAGDGAGDLNGNGIPNCQEYGALDDVDGDGALNADEMAEGTDPFCEWSTPRTEEVPATSGLGLYGLALGTAGAAAVYRNRGKSEKSEK